MGFELLFLLLPVAAFSGWLIGRGRRGPSSRQGGCPDFSSDYFKGLNYLLNEQPDKAIEVFVRMLEVNSETAEMHIALGNLFLRRGEVDRAIRIHQNLIARPTLNQSQRSQALHALAGDYMRAGLFDRAEALYNDLTKDKDHRSRALRQLLHIYEQEKDWDRAIQTAVRLQSETNDPSLRINIAQYHCELAEVQYHAGEGKRALKTLRQATANDPRCVRASLLEGTILAASGDAKGAVRAFRRVEQQDPDYLAETIEPLVECYRVLGRPGELVAYLGELQSRQGSISIMLALADQIREQQGDAEAGAFITECLRQRPSVRGMDRLIELNLAHTEGAARDNLQILKDLTSQLLADKPVYKCHTCGFTGRSLHWQCPGCKSWTTVKPIQGVEGE